MNFSKQINKVGWGFAAIMLATTGALNAQVVTWDFFGVHGDSTMAPGNTDVGLFQAYSGDTSAYELTADAREINNPGSEIIDTSSAYVIENNRGPNEEGIGVRNELSSAVKDTPELQYNQMLFIDLGTDWMNFANWEIKFNSVDGSEEAIFGSVDGVVERSDFTNSVFAGDQGSNSYLGFTPTDQFLMIGEQGFITSGVWTYFDGRPGDDILLNSIRATVVPETSTYVLLGSCLLFAFAMRRKQVKA